MQTKITKRAVDAMQPGDTITDTEVGGFRARRQADAVIYELRYRKAGQRKFLRLGTHGDITPDKARTLAKKRAGEVADNRDPAAERQHERAAATHIVNALLDAFLDRYVRKQGLRSAGTIKSAFDRLVRPRIGTKSIYEVTRRDVVELLDAVEDESGPVMADRTLAYLRKAFNWQATRDEMFTPPIIKGMARTKPRERIRDRILDDQEIRDLWVALDQLGGGAPACYPAFVRALLLTGQRRTNVSHAHSDEIRGDEWLIPASRMKGKRPHLVPLTPAVKALFGGRKGFLFSSDGGKTPFSGYGKAKAALDKKIAELRKADGRKPMAPWVIHDLRRSARSILSRYASPDVAERILGHVVSGMRGVYDHYAYANERRRALQRLAVYVHAIVHPGEVVTPFPKRSRRI
jgi:integrase